ncbi:isoprenylcysteine carboxylmethyltransferase family protein [Rhodoblastus acidophilus]|uniref:Isoprenylcysteine carboxylmethyltransferase family protein n=1 Tax=Candidatus Rhodoblastus alkanivorans TaxID=2954117 RepID=A0ABS9ZBW5_9HYPH|nr:isoprenylcysteine carboxylmethyltransferase family protein [Candidatus Rhodoblastus alkanivorans]MCI4680472.1 isoprenylcysteine carboxylmethyltransferase family protein [Candidatus Rhodoblastus alkanivorans]MCI4684891.1 isoprenylcysteine carboxylmethyltransferase family protein [Candidatus Rhodoblastus alkanivorans]MDI4642215.1 isoprenylcysteine carboxylmethyltransferase family protein [Rhodoblastus acidophilus]
MAAGGRFRGFPRVAAILGGAVVYYALPIWGEGGFGPFFRSPALMALTVVYFALAVAALFCGGNVSPGIREDRNNRWVLPAFALLGLAMGFIPAWDDRYGFLTFGGEALRWSGVVLFGLGGSLRLWPVVALGDRFSGLVAIQPIHELLTTGPYRYIRHPSYLGLMISSIGWALAFCSGAGLVIAALTLLPLLARIDAEERLLQSEFGAEYDAYRARTWRMIPGLW